MSGPFVSFVLLRVGRGFEPIRRHLNQKRSTARMHSTCTQSMVPLEDFNVVCAASSADVCVYAHLCDSATARPCGSLSQC